MGEHCRNLDIKSRLSNNSLCPNHTDCVCRVLESLLESGVLERVREVALDMYNFYHRQGLGLSWARNTDPDMELER